MNEVYFPDFVGRSDQAVVMLVSSLDEKLSGLFERFHRGEQVAYRFNWNLEQDSNRNDVVLFHLEFDSGEKVSIALSPLHWDCLPPIVSLGYLVLMTDPGLLQREEDSSVEDEKPRAFVIHNAFLGLDGLVKQVNERIQDGEAGNLDLLLRLFENGLDGDDTWRH